VDPRAGLDDLEKREISFPSLESKRDSSDIQSIAYLCATPSALSWFACFINTLYFEVERAICFSLCVCVDAHAHSSTQSLLPVLRLMKFHDLHSVMFVIV